MKVTIVLIVAATFADALALGGGARRVVFVRNNDIYTANDDGFQLRRLTADGKPKQYPKWSPDGTRIAYLTSGDMSANPKSRAKINIISASGEPVGTAPVLVTQADGTLVAGMRWVDSIGWNDANHVFAEGSASPYTTEYRTIDIHSGQMGGYGVWDFATCTSKGWVAFWTPVFPPSKATRLEINRKEVGFEFPDVNSLPSISVPLVWMPGCEHLAFLDLRPPAVLVVIHINKVERKVKLPSEDFHLGGLTPDMQGLLLVGSKKTLIYNLRQNALSEAPPTLLKEIQSQRAAREHVVRELSAESPDWFTDAPPSLPGK